MVWERLEADGLLQPGGLGRNPYWLWVILRGGAFEGSKAEILQAAVPKLLEREWDERPPAQRSWRRIEALGRDGQIAAVAQGLAWLSYRTFELARPAPPLDAALGELKKWLEGRVAADGLAARDILGMSRDAQLLSYEAWEGTEGSRPIRFRHDLLRGYLAASAMRPTHRS